jgi:glycine betaine/proline transport system ATP-binding protein
VPDKLEVKNLYKIFGPNPDKAIELAEAGQDKDSIFRETNSVAAVNNVSLTVGAREIFVVMGLSGSGKSTLVRCLNRLHEPTRGSIKIDGEEIVGLDEEGLRQMRLGKIAMVFQHFALLPHKTVCENVEYGLKVRGMDPAERRAKALNALETVGLDAWADAYPDNLSGGMQQRVGLARGLAVDPKILLMDEPFSALDPLIRRDMQAELLDIQKRIQTTIIFITHDLNEALTLGDRIAIMKDGRFVQVGTAAEIVTAPADDYVRAFTQDVDRGRVLSLSALPSRPAVTLDREAGLGAARASLAEEGCNAAYVTNGSGKPLGLLMADDLVGAAKSDRLEDLMRREFPSAEATTRLYEVFESCGDGAPLAIVDGDGRLQGMVEPGDILAGLANDEEPCEAPTPA